MVEKHVKQRATTFGCFKQNILLDEYLVDNLFKM